MGQKTQIDLTTPHVYSLVLTVNDRGSYLYTGVHKNIDEALEAAKTEAKEIVGKTSRPFRVDLDMWNAFDGKQIMKELLPVYGPPTIDIGKKKTSGIMPGLRSVEECVVRIKNARNRLMQLAIEGKETKQLPKIKELLTPHQFRYVKSKLEVKG